MRMNTRKQSVMGKRDPPTGKDVKVMGISDKVQKRLKKNNISGEEYEKMLYFARYQPRGNRKLNDEDLSYLVIGEDQSKMPLTNTQGLRAGGQVSKSVLSNSIKPLTNNKQLNFSIKNNNRIKGNPNFTSFKNQFKFKW
mgnify:CR=1 FL=1